MGKNRFNLSYPMLQKEDFVTTIIQKHKQQLFYALMWNTFESVVYHIIFLAHQTTLYYVVGQAIYGKVGALFSFAFFCITLATLGLDTALIPFIRQLTSSLSYQKILFKNYLLPHALGLAIIIPLILIMSKLMAWIPLIQNYSYTTLLILSFFIVIETLRKIIRHLFQLLFYNKYAALAEIGMVFMYSILFWLGYFLGVSPEAPQAVLIPFLIISCSSLFFLIYQITRVFSFKKQLEDGLNNETQKITINTQTIRSTVTTNQLWITINTATRLLFSSNLLIPLCAASMGYVHAGIATIAHYTTHTLTFFVHKIAMPLVTALFALSEMNDNYVLQRTTFFVTVMCFGSITISITIGTFFIGWFTNHTLSTVTLQYAVGFFILHSTEQLFTLYEKFFASLRIASYVTLTNSISALLALITTYYITSFSLLLLYFIGIRVGALCILSYYVWTWKRAYPPQGTIE